MPRQYERRGMTMEAWLEERSIPEPNSGCRLWEGSARGMGYGVVTYEGRQQQAHRVSYQLANGPIPAGLLVCHKCDVPACINPAHLFLGTPLDNMIDKVAKGRNISPGGELHGQAKLSRDAARAIFLDTRPHHVIAREYGVGQATISALQNGLSYQDETTGLSRDLSFSNRAHRGAYNRGRSDAERGASIEACPYEGGGKWSGVYHALWHRGWHSFSPPLPSPEKDT